jgi:mercuric ion binding protein
MRQMESCPRKRDNRGAGHEAITVKSSLEAVPGVAKAVVSYADKTAVMTFVDAKTAVPALISATTNAGYPSALKS